MTVRDARLQAAVVRDGCLLLVRCTLPGEPPFWSPPGGGYSGGMRQRFGVAVALLGDDLAEVTSGTHKSNEGSIK
jgi:hypothetical protein